jgi:hypothetical protein
VAYRSVPRPSSPPGAKASTECPSLAREHGASKCAFHHAQKPSSVGMLPFIAESCSLSTQQSPLNTRPIAEHPKTFGQTVRWERPETHQNLIHPDKDLPLEFSPRDGATIWRHLWRHSSKEKPTTPKTFASPRYTPGQLHHQKWWR